VAQEVLGSAEPIRSREAPGRVLPMDAPEQGARAPKPSRSESRALTDREVSGQVFGSIRFLLANYPLPAELRAAMYQALTRLDGVELVGEATDLAGRRGISVAMGPGDQGSKVRVRQELILDPDSGRLLGSRAVLTDKVPGWRLRVGTVMDESVFLKTAVVSSPTTRPEAG
jgi:hypothetical protein